MPKNSNDDEIADLEKFLLESEPTPDETSSNILQDVLKSDLADSSDEEEARDCHSSKYNDFGREINRKLKQDEQTRKFDSIRVTQPYSFTPNFTNLSSDPSPSTSTQTCVTNPRAAIKPAESASFFCDPIFGLRIVRPLMSSTAFKDRMLSKVPVGVQRARFHTEKGDMSQDWVIAGVLVSKSPTKNTQKGDPFSIWSISDLRGDIKYVSLFLFKSAHKDLWKTDIGTCIGILNPRVLDRKDDKIEAALSIDNANKVMILGQSKDLGKCRAKKANGDTCDAVINKTDFDVCIFHMKREYNNIKRSEFMAGGIGLGLEGLKNKVLGKSEIFYAGQSFTARKGAAKKPAKMVNKDRDRMMTLSEYTNMPYNPATVEAQQSSQSSSPTVTSAIRRPTGSAATHDSSISQRKKDLDRLKILQGTDKPQIILTAKKENSPAAKPAPIDPNFVPKLSRESLTFSFSVPSTSSASSPSLKKNDMLKQKAAAILKKKPLEANNPNLIKYRGTEAGKRKITDEIASPTAEKKQKVGDTDDENRRKEFIQRMMKATSSHMDLVESKESEVRNKTMDMMEKKEAMEEKMANTMEMKVRDGILLKKNGDIFN